MRFGLLGQLELTGEDGEAIVLPGPRLRVLLAGLLVRANAPVGVEALAEAVWAGAPPPAAARTLNSHVRRLRRLLGPQASRVVARANGYLIRVEPAELDILEFERLCHTARSALELKAWRAAADGAAGALGLWRGEPLADVPSQVLRDEVVPRLGRLRLQALQDRAEAGLRLGLHESMLPELLDAVAAHPLHERLRGQLILALYRCGRRAEALSAYQDARTVLVAELGIEPGQRLQRLHERILAGDAALSAPRPPAGPPPAGASAPPRQLPTAAGHFTGRRRELDLIAEITTLPAHPDTAGGTVVISAIDGMAGVGKTALAVHAAHRLADRFPGGQLFIDLHGHSRGSPPREPGQALASLLRALGVPAERIPADTEECAALYRQRLADTRTLIVLDNALDEAQVRPLLPGHPGCLVLVTSRRRLKGLDDARSLSLDLLPPAEAAALLRAVAGPERIAAHDPLLGEIAGLCGYLPLALRIAGALLRHRPAWSPGHLAGLLRDQHDRVTSLSDGERDLGAVLGLSYTGLPERHRLLLRRLGLFPGPDLEAFAAAAMLECGPRDAAGLLEDLVDHNLLIAQAAGRYRLHDLVRVHARTLAAADPEADRAAALDRLLHYYAYTAQSASVPLARLPRPAPQDPAPAHRPALSGPEAARAWLRAERENLEAAFAHARARALDGHVLALASGLAEILRQDGPYTRALMLQQAAAETAERHGGPAALAAALNERGYVLYLIGEFRAAAEDLGRAVAMYRETGHRLGEANALTELARVRRMTGDYSAALDALSRASDVYRAAGHRDGEAVALTQSGRVRQLAGDTSAAAADLHRAVELCRATGHRLGEAYALSSLGSLQHLTGDLTGALGSFSESLEICRMLGNRHAEALALGYLGQIRALTGENAAALAALSKALEIHRELGNRNSEAVVLIQLGSLRIRAGEHAAARDTLNAAMRVCRAVGHRDGEAFALTHLRNLSARTGDLPAALDQISRALEIYRALGNRNNEAWALNQHAATVAALGDPVRALALYRRSLEMNRELNKPDDEAIALEGIGECHLSSGRTAAGIGYLNQALEIYERLGMAPGVKRVRARLAETA